MFVSLMAMVANKLTSSVIAISEAAAMWGWGQENKAISFFFFRLFLLNKCFGL
jgi:hypothetical protein